MSFTVECLGYAPDYVDYRSAWDLQQRYHAEVIAGTRESTLLFLEHSPVYTAGKRTEDHERPTDPDPIAQRPNHGTETQRDWPGDARGTYHPAERCRPLGI